MRKLEILDQIEKNQSIHWSPWIGDRYFETPQQNRMLVIAESHYLSPFDDKEKTENDLKNKFSSDYIQRMIGEDVQFKFFDPNTTFDNFHKVLFRSNLLDFTKFWGLVSFYNFIQRPMASNNHRPGKGDFQDAWNTFEEVFNLLKPSYCLFIGTSAANHLSKSLKIGDSLTRSIISCPEMINRTYGRTMTINNESSQVAKCIFIKHTSKYVSPEKWHEFLERQMGEQLTWLKSQVLAV
jgi:hypothetical protein